MPQTVTGKLAPNSLCNRIVERLLAKIRRENLMPGDRLGTEAALASKMGVSVRAVREAVARLRVLGILEAKQGVGLLVAHPNPTALLAKVLPIYISQTESIENLYILRRSLELGAIDMAVQNATEEQINKLLRLAETNASSRPRGQTGLDFHRAIFEAAGNRFLREMGELVTRYFLRAAREIKGWSNLTDKVTHRDIARAFKERDPDKARRLMGLHLPAWSNK